MTLQNMLHHPMYAGAYSYGRRQIDPRRKQPGRPSTGRVVRPPAEWHALLRDRVPAYIPWDAYQANLERLRLNRSLAEARGSARKGHALLAGLVVCGLCHRRMVVRYRDGKASYVCQNFASNYGGSSCQHIAGDAVEGWISAQVLRALEPASLALSLEAVRHAETERADLDRLWQQRLARARYEADRAARQYAAVEPEHRLVARQLEAAWEAKLMEHRQLEEAYARFVHERPCPLTGEQIDGIRRLAHDLPALWSAPTTTVVDRKEILRAVIDRIVLRVIDNTERVAADIHWAGGAVTRDVLVRPLRQAEQLSTYAQVCAEIRRGCDAGEPACETAARLNALGLHAARGNAWSEQTVKALSTRLDLRPKRRRRVQGGWDGRDGRWGVTPLARAIGMPIGTLRQWIKCGEVVAERLASGRLMVQADAVRIAQLRERRDQAVSTVGREHWQASLKEKRDVVRQTKSPGQVH
jgi:Recombinase zinc beta ribbon domain